jgi:hypothetical protein
MPNTTHAHPTSKLSLADLLANPKELYQVKQIADVFQKHPETIRRWIKAGTITKPLSINGVYYFKGSDIVDYINGTNEGA